MGSDKDHNLDSLQNAVDDELRDEEKRRAKDEAAIDEEAGIE